MAKGTGTTTTDLYINNEGGRVHVGTGGLNVGERLELRTDGEGGNVRFIPPADKVTSSKTNYWELDAYDGGFRVFRNGSDSSNFNGFKITPAGLFETPGFTDAMVKRLFLATHPVGSYYWSSNATSPQTLFGGTWTQIKDRFVLAAGDTYKVGATGGAASVTSGASSAANTGAHKLTTAEMPSHAHQMTINITSTATSHAATPGSNLYIIGDGQAGGGTSNDGTTNYSLQKNTASTGSNGTHSHTMAHTHSVSTLPPYIVAYCWRRTA